MSSRVVSPEDVRLPLSGGDWIAVKKRLNAGENKRMLKRARLDPIEAGTAQVLAYLLDWSIKGPDDKVIPILDQSPATVEAAIDSIDPDSYTEILRALEAHVAAMEAERDAEKKPKDGATTSLAISPSAGSTDGAMSGLTS